MVCVCARTHWLDRVLPEGVVCVDLHRGDVARPQYTCASAQGQHAQRALVGWSRQALTRRGRGRERRGGTLREEICAKTGHNLSQRNATPGHGSAQGKLGDCLGAWPALTEKIPFQGI